MWDPAVYERYADERTAPFRDLLALVTPVPGGQVVDLGCGTGRLTAEVHRRVRARGTVGVDRSSAMLERAAAVSGGGLRFVRADIAEWEPEHAVDLVFSNAALHWVADHERLLARLTSWLAPGGQLAVQVPANHDHPSHVTAARIASEPPFADVLGGAPLASPVLAPERYATLLHRLGFGEQHVRLQVYAYPLDGPEQVADWVEGSLLTWYRERLGEVLYRRFLPRYREELLAALPAERPFLLTYKRVLLRGRRA
ncbi:MAG: methyltransferase domain-containing protein [Solirubrobacterales bacterium]|nr:methyltransferase domain-containing protein [Solirubrobacterales bacterium]